MLLLIRDLITQTLTKSNNLMRRVRGWYYCNLIKALGGECAGKLRVDNGFLFKFPPHEGIKIGYGVVLGKDVILDVPLGASLTLGDHVNLTKNIVIAATQRVCIGDNVLVAEFTSIRDADHGIDPNFKIREQPLFAKPVTIGQDVWIGRGVAILKGVKIGDGAVIGANAVVTKDVHPYSVMVGNPAKLLKMRK